MFDSSKGAKTKASSIGAVEYPFLSRTYPNRPEKNITRTPYMEFEVL